MVHAGIVGGRGISKGVWEMGQGEATSAEVVALLWAPLVQVKTAPSWPEVDPCH